MSTTSRKLLPIAVIAIVLVAGIATALWYRSVQKEQARLAAETTARLAESEKLLKQFLAQRPLDFKARPLIPQLKPDLQSRALELKSAGTKLQSCIAAIALDDFPSADLALADLRTQPQYTSAPSTPDPFTLLTLEAHRHFRDKHPEKSIAPLEAALNISPDDIPTRFALATALTSPRPAPSQEQLARALDILQSTIPLLRKESPQWALFQRSLALASVQSTPPNYRRTIDAFNAALKIYTRDDFPLDWAFLRDTLGTVYQSSTEGSPRTNATIALLCYKDALAIFTEKEHPLEWAATQFHMGTVFMDLQSGSLEKNLSLALEAFTAASTVFTKDSHPAQFAMTQYNIGSAHIRTPAEPRLEHLQAALTAFQSTLAYYTPSAFPYNNSLSHSNIAAAYLLLGNVLPTEKRSNFRAAISHAKAALLIFTPEKFPADYARTQEILTRSLTAYTTAEGQNPDAIEPAPQ